MIVEEQEFSKKIDFAIWKRLLNFAGTYRNLMLWLIVQMVFIGVFDAIVPLFSKYAVDNIVLVNKPQRLIWLGIAAVLLIALQAVNVRFMILRAGKIESSLPYDIRQAAFDHLQQLSLAYYDVTPVGWIMARLTSDCRRLAQTMSWNIVDLFWSVSMMIITAAFMLFLDWRLALMVLVTVPLLVWISIIFQQRILRNYRQVRKYNSHITAGFNEGITGARTIKTLTVEDEMAQGFAATTETMRGFSVRAATTAALYTPLVLMLGALASGLVLWRGGIRAGQNSSLGISYGTLAAFVAYAVQFFEPVRQFARVFTELNYAQASAERVFSLIDTPAIVTDSEESIARYGKTSDEEGKEKWPTFAGEIEFRDVSFSYDNNQRVLENFNLKIKAGETVALVGETGGGKTTIANLACRFYEPVSGSILVDGVDYRSLPVMWMYRQLGYVLQEPHLFSGSIRENIAYGRQEVTDDDVERAAKIAGAHDFISRLEHGYKSEVGERGNRLSAGQKQLVSFARAVLSNPALFVLDEATSSVDTQTEHQIQQALSRVLEGRTSIVIAHRLSTIRHADRILVIENGKIIEEGSHNDLLRQRGFYWRLYTNQIVQSHMTS
ncbi:MAG: ABC transporter ATP-binding protein [Eubacteriales bacterium]|nr:ABC transporter ATP-binding protein [Eubacteriales bacterium]MDD3197476.1 ABC transporter ATP-binding protein [Eubacteriales bacterium]MDD3504347.1 ABC transporter ATP-binding protein [Eubacteriales bacterium]MDD4682579.1 ABC transporter ATP-binding protein [Eubacteriales bacterium]